MNEPDGGFKSFQATFEAKDLDEGQNMRHLIHNIKNVNMIKE